METFQRRDQTLFIKKAWSLRGFEYAGSKAAMSGVIRHRGNARFPSPVFSGSGGSIYKVTAPQPTKGTITLKKDIVQSLSMEEWLRGRWHIDVRHQTMSPRTSQINWDMIDRYVLARFSGYKSQEEVIFSLEQNAEVLTDLEFECPPRQVRRLYRLDETRHVDMPDDILCLAKVCERLSAKASRKEEGYGVVAGTSATQTGHPWFGRSSSGGQGWYWIEFNGNYGTPNWTNPITGLAGKDEFFIAVSHGEAAHAYTVNAGETWTEIQFPRYTTYAPRAIRLYSNSGIWVCGDNGYVWFSQDAIHGQVAHAGTQVRGDLRRIYVLNDRTILAVGDSNSILLFRNKRWSRIEGPGSQSGDNILCAVAISSQLWAIGYDDGTVWWTEDGGEHWQQDALVNWSAVYDMAYSDARRIAIAGHEGATVQLRDNVHASPDLWEDLGPATGMTGAHAVLTCDENWFIVAGARAGGGTLSVLRRV